MKVCKRCNESKPRDQFYKGSGSQYDPKWDVRDSHCIPCRNQYAVERRRRLKQEAVEYMGGSCVDCGLKTDKYAVYDFHHLDPTQKDFSFGSQSRTLDRVKPELDKCVLLCANCHRIRHSAE